MKKYLVIPSAILAFTLFAFITPHGSGNYEIDTTASTIKWVGKKLTGEHTGMLTMQSGSLAFDKHAIQSGSFVIDMSTINNTDLEGESKADLEGHLKAADFFDVEKFPTAKFEITGGDALQGDPEGYSQMIIGNLTIKGITNEVSFPAKVTVQGTQLTASAKLSFDRTKWDIKYKSKTVFPDLGDKFIYDDIDLMLSISAKLTQ